MGFVWKSSSGCWSTSNAVEMAADEDAGVELVLEDFAFPDFLGLTGGEF